MYFAVYSCPVVMTAKGEENRMPGLGYYYWSTLHLRTRSLFRTKCILSVVSLRVAHPLLSLGRHLLQSESALILSTSIDEDTIEPVQTSASEPLQESPQSLSQPSQKDPLGGSFKLLPETDKYRPVSSLEWEFASGTELQDCKSAIFENLCKWKELKQADTFPYKVNSDMVSGI